eukprot:TRINITY_DN5892_c0_g1_i1.p2 TRINITY_DN5892_c0_g1~~TRINITY_DN5892_c0_g1_i1.p2  ORF type:complete len:119 (+),score=11.17 TRINITY_DN5892_c0_g1_i1:672-1028(+)
MMKKKVLNVLQGDRNSSGIVVCQDDYEHWHANNYKPSSGKPMWIDFHNKDFHHIFFDDNVHNDPDDSIVAVRVRKEPDGDFRPLNGEETRDLHGERLFKVFTMRAILDEEYFNRLLNI